MIRDKADPLPAGAKDKAFSGFSKGKKERGIDRVVTKKQKGQPVARRAFVRPGSFPYPFCELGNDRCGEDGHGQSIHGAEDG